MPTLTDIRQQFPQYNDLPDEQLLAGLHRKFYADLPFDDFLSKVGASEEPGFVDNIVGSGKRGLLSAEQAMVTDAAATGMVSPEAAGGYIADTQQQIDEIPVPESVQRFFGTETWSDAAVEFVQSPLEITSTLVAQSLGTSIPSFAGAAVGAGAGSLAGPGGAVAGGAIGLGAGSAATETGAKILESFAEQGVDLADPAQVAAAFANDELMESVRGDAVKRGVTIGVFDAVSGAIAGRLVAGARGVGSAVARGTGEVGIQSGLGMAGEAAGSAVIGDPISPPDVLAEGLGEIGTGGVEVAAGTAVRGLGAAGRARRGDEPVIRRPERVEDPYYTDEIVPPAEPEADVGPEVTPEAVPETTAQEAPSGIAEAASTVLPEPEAVVEGATPAPQQPAPSETPDPIQRTAQAVAQLPQGQPISRALIQQASGLKGNMQVRAILAAMENAGYAEKRGDRYVSTGRASAASGGTGGTGAPGPTTEAPPVVSEPIETTPEEPLPEVVPEMARPEPGTRVRVLGQDGSEFGTATVAGYTDATRPRVRFVEGGVGPVKQPFADLVRMEPVEEMPQPGGLDPAAEQAAAAPTGSLSPDQAPPLAAPEAAEPQRRPARPRSAPVPLFQFIRDQGGIDPSDPLIGDVRASLDKQTLQLLRKPTAARTGVGGRRLDDLRGAAVQAGYLPENSTIADFLDAIQEDAFRQQEGQTRIYRDDDMAEVVERERAAKESRESERYLARFPSLDVAESYVESVRDLENAVEEADRRLDEIEADIAEQTREVLNGEWSPEERPDDANIPFEWITEREGREVESAGGEAASAGETGSEPGGGQEADRSGRDAGDGGEQAGGLGEPEGVEADGRAPWRVEPYDGDAQSRFRVARNDGSDRRDVWGHYATREQAESAREYAAKRAPASEGVATEQTDQGEQILTPGVRPVTDKDRAETKAAKPLRSDKAQKPADDGLFDVAGRGQGDLLSQPSQEASPAPAPGKPIPLYVSRPVTNAEDILAWARSQGFENTLAADDLHVTIAYSRDPVAPNAAGKPPEIQRAVGRARSVERLGDEGAVVLRFESTGLQNRWQQYRNAGASWDHEGYKPHVTITYDPGDVDLSTVEPYRGPIELGPETGEPLDDDATPSAETTPEDGGSLDIADSQTDTPAFRRWFGDSKVVDENGEPLVVYHGTPDARGLLNDGAFRPPVTSDEAYFFTDSQAVARTYADPQRAWDYQGARPAVGKLYLSIKNPMVIDANGASWGERGGPMSQAEQIAEAKAAGHDGLIIRNTLDAYNVDGKARADVFVTFRPTQAKSAETGAAIDLYDRTEIEGSGPNRGAFDPDDPRIRFDAETSARADAFTDAVYGRPTVDGEKARTAVEKLLARIAPDAKVHTPDRLTDPETGRDRAYGLYIDGVIHVALNGPNADRTARHEAIHFLRQRGIISDINWRALTKAADDQDWIGRFRIRERYKRQGLTEGQMVEEAIAEGYAEWAAGGREEKGRVVAAFRHLRRLFDQVRAAIRRAVGREPDFRDLFSEIETGRMGRQSSEAPSTGSPFADMLLRGVSRLLPAYHGSPHDFDRFSLEKIGTGEGAQAYGWGLYFSSRKEIAEWYRDQLKGSENAQTEVDEAAKTMLAWEDISEQNAADLLRRSHADGVPELAGDKTVLGLIVRYARGLDPDDSVTDDASDAIRKLKDLIDERFGGGRVYEVELTPEPEHLLDWDKPLSEQSEHVKERLDRWGRENRGYEGPLHEVWRGAGKGISGDAAYRSMSVALGGDRAASLALLEAGIPGIRYYDNASRGTAGGELLSVEQDDGKWLAKVRVTNRAVMFSAPGTAITTRRGFDTEADARTWAENAIEADSRNYVIFDENAVEVTAKYELANAYAETNPGHDIVDDATKAREASVGFHRRVIARMDRFLNPIEGLPEIRSYLAERYRTFGKIAQVQDVAGHLTEPFEKASKADSEAVYEYMTTKDASPDAIADRDVREAAVKAKRAVDKIGRQLVAKGLLRQEAYDRHKDAYLPRVYLRHLLEKQGVAGSATVTAGGKKVSDLGYLKQRKDIDENTRRFILGEILDPKYLASRALVKPARDIALLDFLDHVAKNERWIIPQSVVSWNGQRVTAMWLKSEAATLRRMTDHQSAEDAAVTSEIAKSMEAAAEDALREFGIRNSDIRDYRQVPDAPRYGRMRGLWVRKEIHEDLVGSTQWVTGDGGNFAQRLLSQGGTLTKATQLWKLGKVALNPPTQIRNAFSNAIMLHLSGVNGMMVIPRLIEAVQDMRAKGEYFQVARRYGITEATFAHNELFRLEGDLKEAMERSGSPMAKVAHLLGKIGNAAGDIYQGVESAFKIAKIIDEMKKGRTAETAALEAQKWLFDYSLVSGSTQYLRNAPLGVPFITYYTKVMPRLVEVAATKPWKLAPYVALPAALAAWVAAEYDVDQEDLDKLREALPTWLRNRGGGVIPLPYRDGNGNWQFVDLSYFFPWAMFEGLARAGASGDVTEFLSQAGILGGPVPQIISAFQTGIDPFSEKPIVDEYDRPAKKLASLLNFAWSLSMPPWMTEYGFANRLYEAMSGTVDPRTGKPRYTEGQAMLRAVGVNVYPIDPVASRASNIRRMKFEVSEVKSRMRRELRDKNLTPDQRRAIVADYREMLAARVEQMREYAAASQVNPKLLRPPQ